MATQVKDQLTGAVYAIRSKYLVGAGGARSTVPADPGLPFGGPGAVGGALRVIFEADLSRFVAHRPSVLYWTLQPGAEKEGVGLGVLRMWHEWMLMWGYQAAAGPPEITDEFARELAVKLYAQPTRWPGAKRRKVPGGVINVTRVISPPV